MAQVEHYFGIWDSQGKRCDEKDSIAQATIDYFNSIYTTASPSQIDEVVIAIPTWVTGDKNESLNRNFTRGQVATVLSNRSTPQKHLAPMVCLPFFTKNIGALWDVALVLNVLKIGRASCRERV